MSSTPVVYMDACCYIDLVKEAMSQPVLASRKPHVYYCRKFLEAARAGEARVFTSTMTVVECVKLNGMEMPSASKADDEKVKTLFRGMLLSARSGVMPVIPTIVIVEGARDLRWNHGITCKPMDAMHIATAVNQRCTHFITTDSRLGEENIAKIAALGLTVCQADHIAHLLPTHHRQYPLTQVPAPKEDSAAEDKAG